MVTRALAIIKDERMSERIVAMVVVRSESVMTLVQEEPVETKRARPILSGVY